MKTKRQLLKRSETIFHKLWDLKRFSSDDGIKEAAYLVSNYILKLEAQLNKRNA